VNFRLSMKAEDEHRRMMMRFSYTGKRDLEPLIVYMTSEKLENKESKNFRNKLLSFCACEQPEQAE